MKLKRRNTTEFVTLDTKHPVAVAAESCLYSINGSPDLVAKVYRTDANDHVRRILAMVAHPPKDPTAAQGHVTIAWPVDLLYTEDMRDCAGYLMPRLGQARPLADLINPTTRRHNAPHFNYRYLGRTARNLAGALDALHVSDYVVGDMCDTSVMVADSALVTMVDTETFQIRDHATNTVHRCLSSRPEYTAPELQGVLLDAVDRLPEQDCFALAVLIFQLLMEGNHPFTGDFTGDGQPLGYAGRIKGGHFVYGTTGGPYVPRSSSPAFTLLPPSLRDLFLRCFEDGHTSPRARPVAHEWAEALQDAEGHMLACPANPEHIYPSHLDACPWCKRAEASGSHDPFPSRDAVEFDHTRTHTVAQAPLPAAGAKPARPPVAAARPTSAVIQQPAATALPAQAVAAGPATPLAATIASTTPKAAAKAASPLAMPAHNTRPKPDRKSPVVVWTIAVVLVALAGLGFGYSRLHNPGTAVREMSLSEPLHTPSTAYIGYITTAQADLAQATPEDADASAAAHTFAQAAHLCRQALADIGATPMSPDATTDRATAQALLSQVDARRLALDARLELDDVTGAIKENSGRRLTVGEVSALKARLLTDCAKAQDDCAQALAKDPQCVSGWIERIRAYRLAADNAAARTALQSALVAFPDDPHLLDQQAQLNRST